MKANITIKPFIHCTALETPEPMSYYYSFSQGLIWDIVFAMTQYALYCSLTLKLMAFVLIGVSGNCTLLSGSHSRGLDSKTPLYLKKLDSIFSENKMHLAISVA